MSSTNNPIPFQKGHTLAFPCTHCRKELSFSIFELDKNEGRLQCPHCHLDYLFSDPRLLRQLRLFENLCRQIQDSEEILGTTNVGVDVGPHRVEIPFKLLLTRFNSQLKLKLGSDEVTIAFRLEPQKLPEKT